MSLPYHEEYSISDDLKLVMVYDVDDISITGCTFTLCQNNKQISFNKDTFYCLLDSWDSVCCPENEITSTEIKIGNILSILRLGHTVCLKGPNNTYLEVEHVQMQHIMDKCKVLSYRI